MTQEIKDEVLEQIEKDVLMGFESAEEMTESIADMFADEDDFDEDWLAETIEARCEEHKENSFNWSKPTDFERLDAAFTHLIKNGIVCLHNAGYTKQDSISDCEDAIEELEDMNVEVTGYCYYHAQDLERAIDPTSKSLLLGFDSVGKDDEEAVIIGDTIVEVLKVLNFEVNWDGTIEHRIEIKNINWQKIPNEEDWGVGRVINIWLEKDDENAVKNNVETNVKKYDMENDMENNIENDDDD